MRTSGFRIAAGIVVALFVVVGIIAMQSNTRDAGYVSSREVRDAAPTMRAIELAFAQCETAALPTLREADGDGGETPSCSTSTLVGSVTGVLHRLRDSRSCIAPRSACVSVDDGALSVQLVTGEIPDLGRLRIEAANVQPGQQVAWRCRPLRSDADRSLVKAACDDIPVTG